MMTRVGMLAVLMMVVGCGAREIETCSPSNYACSGDELCVMASRDRSGAVVDSGGLCEEPCHADSDCESGCCAPVYIVAGTESGDLTCAPSSLCR